MALGSQLPTTWNLALGSLLLHTSHLEAGSYTPVTWKSASTDLAPDNGQLAFAEITSKYMVIIKSSKPFSTMKKNIVERNNELKLVTNMEQTHIRNMLKIILRAKN